MGDRLVARPQPRHRTTQTQNKRTQTFMPQVGFEPTIPVFKRAKTVHALDRAPTVIGIQVYIVCVCVCVCVCVFFFFSLINVTFYCVSMAVCLLLDCHTATDTQRKLLTVQNKN
jgi:hypothetical protein